MKRLPKHARSLSKTSLALDAQKTPFVRSFLKRILDHAGTYRLLPHGAHILVAVSGGPDSICLLDVLFLLSKQRSLQLSIVHVNYRLRGKDADADARLVQKMASLYDIPCTVFSPKYDTHDVSEETLRKIRYAFFEKLRKQKKCAVIAVAHNEDDQAETVLLRIIRGAGLTGLAAMRPKNGFIIRPLMTTSRVNILRYLEERGIPYRQDVSNQDTRFLRNRIRHVLLPLLERDFQPNIKKLLAKNATLIAEDVALVETLLPPLTSLAITRHSVSFSRTEMLAHPLPFVRYHLRSLIKPFLDTLPPSKKLIDEIIKILKSQKNKSQQLAFKGLKLERKGDKVTLLFSADN